MTDLHCEWPDAYDHAQDLATVLDLCGRCEDEAAPAIYACERCNAQVCEDHAHVPEWDAGLVFCSTTCAENEAAESQLLGA